MKKCRFNPSAAFSLVEIALALGVAAFCFVAIFGLLPVGLNTNQASSEQAAATAVVNTVLADLRSTPAAPTAASPVLGLIVPYNSNEVQTRFFDAGGRVVTDLKAAPTDFVPRYRARVSFPPRSTGVKTATYALVQVTWPAQAKPGFPGKLENTNLTDESKVGGLLESFLALDRN